MELDYQKLLAKFVLLTVQCEGEANLGYALPDEFSPDEMKYLIELEASASDQNPR